MHGVTAERIVRVTGTSVNEPPIGPGIPSKAIAPSQGVSFTQPIVVRDAAACFDGSEIRRPRRKASAQQPPKQSPRCSADGLPVRIPFLQQSQSALSRPSPRRLPSQKLIWTTGGRSARGGNSLAEAVSFGPFGYSRLPNSSPPECTTGPARRRKPRSLHSASHPHWCLPPGRIRNGKCGSVRPAMRQLRVFVSLRFKIALATEVHAASSTGGCSPSTGACPVATSC